MAITSEGLDSQARPFRRQAVGSLHASEVRGLLGDGLNGSFEDLALLVRLRRALALRLSQHPDAHGPDRPVLLAVDQQLGEGGSWDSPRSHRSARLARSIKLTADTSKTWPEDHGKN